MRKNDGVTFEAGGKSRRLRFSANAFCDLEDATGVSMFNILGVLDSDPTLTFVRACLWAGLRGGDDTITQADVGDLIDDIGVLSAIRVLIEAITAAFPVPKAKDGDENPPTPQVGTGTPS